MGFYEKIKTRLPGGKIYECMKIKGDDEFLKMFHDYYREEYFKKHSNVCVDKYLTSKDYFEFADLQFPAVKTVDDFDMLIGEAPDVLFPYKFGNDNFDYSKIEKCFDEGPYEISQNICLKKGDVVIDCGANMGLFSKIALAKSCEVYAFEPNAAMQKRFLSKYNDEALHIENYALSDCQGEMEFVEMLDGESSSYLEGIGNMGKEYIGFRTAELQATYTGNVKKYKVRIISLDEWAEQRNIQKIDFIKADIEGAERLMLSGGQMCCVNLRLSLPYVLIIFQTIRKFWKKSFWRQIQIISWSINIKNCMHM